MYGGIEAGGTKFVCAVGTGPTDLRPPVTIPTTTPDETLARVAAFFHSQPEPITALGVGAFGPVDIHPHSPTYGSILATPKAGWSHTDLRRRLQALLAVPIGVDTDVNAAALGEHRWGAAQGLDNFVYLTVGTGIGGGAMVGGRLLHGLVHPEMGHFHVPHDQQRDPFAGICPFHADCLEGLASGPALQQRWGVPARDLPPEHPAWDLEAHYLALGVSTLICALSPQRVILGGGVMQGAHLFPKIRAAVQAILSGYVQAPELGAAIDTYIVPPGLSGRAGVLGAIALAADAT